MTKDKMLQTGARLLGEAEDNCTASLRDLKKLIPVPISYSKMLASVGGAIVFDRGAKIKSIETSPLDDRNGYQSIELIYGLGSGRHSILHQKNVYEGELPPFFVPIGEASGGNLICVGKSGSVHLWDHESAGNGGVWRIADTIEEFFERIEPDEQDDEGIDGIIHSKSSLDF